MTLTDALIYLAGLLRESIVQACSVRLDRHRPKRRAFGEGAPTVVETLWNHKTADKFCPGRIIRGEMARGGLQGFTERGRSENPFVEGFVIRRWRARLGGYGFVIESAQVVDYV